MLSFRVLLVCSLFGATAVHAQNFDVQACKSRAGKISKVYNINIDDCNAGTQTACQSICSSVGFPTAPVTPGPVTPAPAPQPQVVYQCQQTELDGYYNSGLKEGRNQGRNQAINDVRKDLQVIGAYRVAAVGQGQADCIKNSTLKLQPQQAMNDCSNKASVFKVCEITDSAKLIDITDVTTIEREGVFHKKEKEMNYGPENGPQCRAQAQQMAATEAINACATYYGVPCALVGSADPASEQKKDEGFPGFKDAWYTCKSKARAKPSSPAHTHRCVVEVQARPVIQ